MKVILYMFALLLFVQVGGFCQENNKEYGDWIKKISEAAIKAEEKVQFSWDARINSVYGQAYVKSENSEDWSVIKKGLPLEFGDKIKTDAGANVVIAFNDEGIVRVEGNTEIEVSSLKKDGSLLKLAAGSLIAKIEHFFDKTFRFRIKTPTAVCAVRGTEFAVEYSVFKKETGVAVFDEGEVAVKSTQESERGFGEKEIVIGENTEIFLGPNIKRLKKARLYRMARHKSRLLEIRKKVKEIKKRWKPLSGKRKQYLRKKFLKRKVMRENLKKKIRDGKIKRKPGKRLKKIGQKKSRRR